MPNKDEKRVNMVRPSGEVISVKMADVKDFLSLGYRLEEPEERVERLGAEMEREEYTTSEEKAKAFAEGALSTFTFGASDLFTDDSATRKRAEHNKTERAIGSGVGIIASLPFSPFSGAGRAVAGPGLGGKVAAGVMEGAIAGAGGEVTRSTLSGDPLTVEQVMSGAGLGAIFGGGAMAVGHGLQKFGESAPPPKAAGGKTKDPIKLEDEFVARYRGEKPPSVAADDTSQFLDPANRYDIKPEADVLFKNADNPEEAADQAVEALLPRDRWAAIHGTTEDMRRQADELLAQATAETEQMLGNARQKVATAATQPAVPLNEILARGTTAAPPPEAAGPTIPDGWTQGTLSSKNKKNPFTVQDGLPTYEAHTAASKNTLYVVSPEDLVSAGALGTPTKGESLESITEAWASGKKLPPIDVTVLKDGTYVVTDGNHRLAVALEQGRPLAVKVTAAAKNPLKSAKPLSELLPKPEAAYATKVGKVGNEVYQDALVATGVDVKRELASVRSRWRWVQDAVKKGDTALAKDRIKAYRESVEALAAKTGKTPVFPEAPAVKAPKAAEAAPAPAPEKPITVDEVPVRPTTDADFQPPPDMLEDAAESARRDFAMKNMEQMAKFGAAVKALKLPNTPVAFARMGPDAIEKLMAQVDAIMKVRLPKVAGVQAALAKQLDDMAAQMGIMAPGRPVDNLREIWKTANEAGNAVRATWKKDSPDFKITNDEIYAQLGITSKDMEAAGVIDPNRPKRPESTLGKKQRTSAPDPDTLLDEDDDKPGWLGRAAKRVANYQMHRMAYGAPPGFSPYGIASLLLTLGAGVKDASLFAARKLARPTGKALQAVGPRVEPLYRSLTGVDDPEGDIREAFQKRSKEVRELIGTSRDRAFALAQDLSAAGHPEFAKALYDKSVMAIEVLAERLPKSPPGTRWGTEYLWDVPAEQLAVFSQEWEAVVKPDAFLMRLADAPTSVFPSAIKAFQSAYPEIYADFRAQVMLELADTGTKHMSVNDLSALSVALNLPLLPTHTSEFIAQQQAMFLPKNQPAPPQPAGGGQTGRPPGADMTKSQRIMNR